MLHRQRDLEHPGQLGMSPGGRSRTQGSGEGAVAAWHTLAHMGCSQHTQGAQAVPGSRRLPGKCPRGRDGQGCAPCPARKALPTCCQLLFCSAWGLSPWAAAGVLSEFTGWREFPGQPEASSTSMWDEEGAGWVGKGTAVGVSLEHSVLLCSSG